MKQSIIFFTTLVMCAMLMACSTSNKATDAEQLQLKAVVQQTLGQREFTIQIDNMGHKLIIKPDQVVCNLPYVGTGTDVGYGASGFKSLNFTAPITDWELIYPKDKKADIKFKVNNNEDNYDFHIEVFYNGKAFIDITPRGRQGAHYSGVLAM